MGAAPTPAGHDGERETVTGLQRAATTHHLYNSVPRTFGRVFPSETWVSLYMSYCPFKPIKTETDVYKGGLIFTTQCYGF